MAIVSTFSRRRRSGNGSSVARCLLGLSELGELASVLLPPECSTGSSGSSGRLPRLGEVASAHTRYEYNGGWLCGAWKRSRMTCVGRPCRLAMSCDSMQPPRISLVVSQLCRASLVLRYPCVGRGYVRSGLATDAATLGLINERIAPPNAHSPIRCLTGGYLLHSGCERRKRHVPSLVRGRRLAALPVGNKHVPSHLPCRTAYF